jgi:hypothetical protein
VPYGCWKWTGLLSHYGYGRFTVGTTQLHAHRLAYSFFRGPIPDGLPLDHLCRTRSCVNPDHLAIVTNRTNLLCGLTTSAAHLRKTHCPKGHPYQGDNLFVDSDGARRCRICMRARFGNDASRKYMREYARARRARVRAAKAEVE